MKVSAVVPVYNPGEHIERCAESLVNQTLPKDQYEVIFVDDGSTDETPARLDRLADEHPHVRVEHIPNSGWPGKPRNVGTDMARGEFVLYVDNDDWVEPDALERLYDAAIGEDADIVIGKVVGHGKFVARDLFKTSRAVESIDWQPLLSMLTPHKLFRRSLLVEHGIRFPEGRRRLEDHMFVVHTYFHAKRIYVIADHPIYHWVRHEDGNASYDAFDPVGYYQNVREVLDLVEEHTEPGPLRDKLLSHWYRGKMLNRVGGRSFMKRDPDYRRELHAEIRKLAVERFDEGVHAWLAPSRRVRSHLLREGTLESLEKLSGLEAELRADVTVSHGRWEDDGTFIIPFEARLVERNDRPLRFERREGRVFWVPPELPDQLPERMREVTDDLFGSRARIIVKSAEDKREYVLPSTNKVKLEPIGDGCVAPVLTGQARLEPATAGGGSPLRPGRWLVLAGVNVIGFSAVGNVRRRKTGAEYKIRINEDGSVRRKQGPKRIPEAPSLKGRLARRFPGLARQLRRRRAARREAAAG